MTSQRRCYARDLYATSRFGTSLVNFGFIMYQNQIIHVIIGFKHDVSCIVRSEALRGQTGTSMHSAPRASCIDWSSCPLGPPISQCTIHHAWILKQFIGSRKEVTPGNTALMSLVCQWDIRPTSACLIINEMAGCCPTGRTYSKGWNQNLRDRCPTWGVGWTVRYALVRSMSAVPEADIKGRDK